jgi:hypothetical protein
MLPFSGKMKKNSIKLYGHCVSKWVTIRPSMKYVSKSRGNGIYHIPMKVSGHKPDIYAYNMLDQLKRDPTSTTKLILITHRTEEFFINSHQIELYVPRERTTYMFLGKHTKTHALEQLKNIAQENTAIIYSYPLDHFYPVQPLSYMLGDSKASKLTAYRLREEQDVMFTIQGNFVFLQ